MLTLKYEIDRNREYVIENDINMKVLTNSIVNFAATAY